MTERCGCDESIALRRELEAGTVAMYRARARDAERARDEMAREVALLGRRLADLTAATDAEAARLQSELLEAMRERDEARAAFLRVAQAVGVVYSADGHAEEAGPVDEVVGEVRRLVAQSAERDEARAQLAALRGAVERALLCGALRLVDTPEEAAAARALETATYDAGAAAEAHDRRVRAEALREAAACTVDGLRLWGRKAQGDASEWLRARADEIERGER